MDENGVALPPKTFILKPEKDKVDIGITLHKRPISIKTHITQFGFQINLATTGHKLQGMSKENLIVADWNYSVRNWVYVVLSRVKSRKGLFLLKS